MLKSLLKRFLKHDAGNVSMMFGLALIPILGASGAAIDYSRFSNAKSALVGASDAGALAGAISRGSITDRRNAAQSVFEANLKQANFKDPVTVNYVNLLENNQNAGYRVEVTGNVQTLFGSFVGQSVVPIKNTAEAKSATDTPLDIAFVLDTTGSMEGARLTSLKSATNGILDDITASPLRPGMVRMGIVPFAQYVNVGLANRNQPWINVPADVPAAVTTQCTMELPVVGETNCRNIPAYSCTNDGVTKMCPGYRQCDPVFGPTLQNICRQVYGPSQTWYGCVGSRNYPLNTQDGDYGQRIPGIMNTWCASEIQPLTSNVSTVRASINGLTAYGDTYLPSGLIWGWRMLSSKEPLTASLVNGLEPRKFMILVTDGRNTASPNYPDHFGNDAVLSDKLTREICTNIAADKTSNVRIFTIAFEMDGLDAKTILQNCAINTGGLFFDAANAAQLRTSMSKALESIMKISLTK
jgi:Flp pilus assembly protein TadG